MKIVSMVALAAAMLSVAAPAAAQKNKKPEEPKLELSAAFRTPAAAAQTAIAAKDWATADTHVTAAEAVAQNDDEKWIIAEMRLTVEANKKSNEGIARALDTLIASPRTARERLPTYYFYRGDAAFKLKQYPVAITNLIKARELGAKELDIPLYLAQSYDATGNQREAVAEMMKLIDQTKASGGEVKDNWYTWAVARLYKTGDRAATAALMMRQLREFPTTQNWRKTIVLYRDSVNAAGTQLDRRQRIDLFRLMRATKTLADQNDYFDYSKAAVEGGLPWEGGAVIVEGRASGKVPASSADFNQVAQMADTAIKTEGSLDVLARNAAKAANGREAAGTGDAFLSSGNNVRALELYDLALQKGGVEVNEVQLHRGIALANLGRKDEAKAAFALVQTAPLKDIAGFWTVWLDLPAPLT